MITVPQLSVELFLLEEKNSLDILTQAFFSKRASLVYTFCLHNSDRVFAIDKGTVSL